MVRGISQTVCATNPKNSIISPLFYELGIFLKFVDKIASQKNPFNFIQKHWSLKTNTLQSKWPTLNLVKRKHLFPGSKINKGFESPKVNTL